MLCNMSSLKTFLTSSDCVTKKETEAGGKGSGGHACPRVQSQREAENTAGPQ